MENKNTCCFIGHREIKDHDGIYKRVKDIVRDLIVNKGVTIFNFGSKSEFDGICHKVVTEFQNDYPDVIRIKYNRKSEYVVKKEEKEALEKSLSKLAKEEITLKAFEGEKRSDRVYYAGRASYAIRNEEMIDDSYYCVFFYNEDYKPEPNKYYKSSGKSGTKLAYDYAVRKKKNIINLK